MGTTGYFKCKELIEEHFKKDDEIGIIRLSEIIIKEIGADPRTIENTLKTMMTTRLIKDIGNCHFKIL